MSLRGRRAERHTENRGLQRYIWKDGANLRPFDIPAPAKINLFLAITGKRSDGFHDLLSVVAPLLWGDTVTVDAQGDAFTVECDTPDIPTDGSNLVLKAAAAFAEATAWKGGARFSIKKRIPSGAGLGGASSDAVAALLGLNAAAGNPLDAAGLLAVASRVGSDCALFLSKGPVILRGRGERVESLPNEAYRRIRGMRVFLFKPAFPIPTPWSYCRLAAEAPRGYVSAMAAEARMGAWMAKAASPAQEILFNSMERPAFAKVPALPALLDLLSSRFGISGRMSGSGSACYAFLHESVDTRPVEAAIREAWGPSAFVLETRIA
jgi:4-diphosphocytidyl-2-C-methyl-D-erythritol kinase